MGGLIGRLSAHDQSSSSSCALLVGYAGGQTQFRWSISHALRLLILWRNLRPKICICIINFMRLYTSVKKFLESVIYGKIACVVYSLSKVFPHICGNVYFINCIRSYVVTLSASACVFKIHAFAHLFDYRLIFLTHVGTSVPSLPASYSNNLPKSAAGMGRLNRYPCAWSHICVRRNWSCSALSTPSPTTSRPIERAMPIIALISASFFGFCCIS